MSDEFEEIVKKYRDGAIYAAGRGHDTVPVNIVVRHIDEMADEIRSAIVERTAEPVGYGYAPEMQSGKGGFWVSWEQSNAYDTPVYSTPPAAPEAGDPCLWDCVDAPMEICPTSGKPCPSHTAPAPQTIAALSASPSPVDSRDGLEAATVKALDNARTQILSAYRVWVADDIAAFPPPETQAGEVIAQIDTLLAAKEQQP